MFDHALRTLLIDFPPCVCLPQCVSVKLLLLVVGVSTECVGYNSSAFPLTVCCVWFVCDDTLDDVIRSLAS